MLARAFAAAIGAARRGTLHRLTPRSCVGFAVRQLRDGRSFAGTSMTCVMSRATRLRRGVRVGSLHRQREVEDGRLVTLAEMLADRDAEPPLEHVRPAHDYPAIFEREGLSEKAHRVFEWLADGDSSTWPRC